MDLFSDPSWPDNATELFEQPAAYSQPRPRRKALQHVGHALAYLAIILLVIGVLAKIGIVWTTGFVVLILGLIALLLGTTGHGIGGRRHYF